MQRVRLCVTIVALLCVISFSARALVSGSAESSSDGISAAQPTATPKPGLGPDGRQVRVISLSPGEGADEAGAVAAQPPVPRPEVLQLAPPAPTPVMAEGARVAAVTPAEAKAGPAANPVARAHRAPKRPALTPAKTQVTPARLQKLFIVSGLF
jgi:hypothetical protein